MHFKCPITKYRFRVLGTPFGFGLFLHYTSKPIRPNTIIGYFDGIFYDDDNNWQNSWLKDYVINFNDKTFGPEESSREAIKCGLYFANCPSRSFSQKANVRLITRNVDKPALYTTKLIKPGEQILANYGTYYVSKLNKLVKKGIIKPKTLPHKTLFLCDHCGEYIKKSLKRSHHMTHFNLNKQKK